MQFSSRVAFPLLIHLRPCFNRTLPETLDLRQWNTDYWSARCNFQIDRATRVRSSRESRGSRLSRTDNHEWTFVTNANEQSLFLRCNDKKQDVNVNLRSRSRRHLCWSEFVRRVRSRSFAFVRVRTRLFAFVRARSRSFVQSGSDFTRDDLDSHVLAIHLHSLLIFLYASIT